MSVDQTRVTIAMRTKDRPRLLARALADVLAQEFSAWHLVILNDSGDSDALEPVIAPFRERLDGRLTVLHPEQRLGREGATNAAVGARHDEYLVVHDDDDTWAPSFLAETVGHLDAHPDAVAVSTATEIIYEEIRDTEIVETGRAPFNPPGGMVTTFDLLLINRIVPISLLVRRDAWKEVGGFDGSLVAVGDWDFNLRLSQLGRIDHLPDAPLAFWHHRPQSVGGSANSMYAEADAHYRFDRVVRDRAIRDHVARTGGGDLLYLSKFIDERVAHSEHELRARIGELEGELARRTDALEGQVRYYSLGETIARNVRKVFGRR